MEFNSHNNTTFVVLFIKRTHFIFEYNFILFLKMKNASTLFLVFSTIIVFGQAPTQKDILGLPNVDLVKDYHYNISKKIPLKTVSQNFGKVESKFEQTFTSEYVFDSKSLKIKELS